jgi:hypothetical protein
MPPDGDRNRHDRAPIASKPAFDEQVADDAAA